LSVNRFILNLLHPCNRLVAQLRFGVIHYYF
jgi:hypothetical protein